MRTEGVRVVKNVLVPMRDGVRLAADLYMPDPDPGEPLPVVMEYIPYRKDEVVPGTRFYDYFPRNGYIVARVDIRGTGGSGGVNVDEYMPAGAARRLRRDRVAGGAAVVRRPRQHDGDLLRRLHLAPGGDAPAAAPDEHHPHVLHRRPLHRRLPLPRRPPAQVLRRRPLRQLHDRLQRPAALPRVVRRRLGDDLGGAPRPQRALPPQLARAPDGRPLLAARLGARRRRPDRAARSS